MRYINPRFTYLLTYLFKVFQRELADRRNVCLFVDERSEEFLSTISVSNLSCLYSVVIYMYICSIKFSA